MKALQFSQLNQAGLKNLPDPRPAEGEVLLRVDAAGMCHTDLDILHGNYGAAFPIIPGHEVAGTVVDVGPETDRSWINRRVAVNPLVNCGQCRACQRGRHNLCEDLRAYGAEYNGGLAEFATIKISQLHDIGDLPAGIAALSEPLACAMNGAQRANAGPDDEVLIIGAGPIGLLILIAFHNMGATRLVVVEPQAPRRARAEAFGAVESYASIADAISARQSQKYDLVVDVTGRPDVVQEATNALAIGGRLLLFGVCPPGSLLQLDPNDIYAREITVLGSFSVNNTLASAVLALQSTPFPVADMITHNIRLDDLPGALSLIGEPDSLKVQVSAST